MGVRPAGKGTSFHVPLRIWELYYYWIDGCHRKASRDSIASRKELGSEDCSPKSIEVIDWIIFGFWFLSGYRRSRGVTTLSWLSSFVSVFFFKTCWFKVWKWTPLDSRCARVLVRKSVRGKGSTECSPSDGRIGCFVTWGSAAGNLVTGSGDQGVEPLKNIGFSGLICFTKMKTQIFVFHFGFTKNTRVTNIYFPGFAILRK